MGGMHGLVVSTPSAVVAVPIPAFSTCPRFQGVPRVLGVRLTRRQVPLYRKDK